MEHILADTRRFGNTSYLRIDYRAARLERREFSHGKRTITISESAERFNAALNQSLQRAGLDLYTGRLTHPQVSPTWQTPGQNPFVQYDALRRQHVDEVIADLAHEYLHTNNVSQSVVARYGVTTRELKPVTVRRQQDELNEAALHATLYHSDNGLRLAVRAGPGLDQLVIDHIGTPTPVEPWRQVEPWLIFVVGSTRTSLEEIRDHIEDRLKPVAQTASGHQNSRVYVAYNPGQPPEELEAFIAA